jgi:hypothetical protein
MWGSLFTEEEIERMKQIIETCDNPKARHRPAKKSSKKRTVKKRNSTLNLSEETSSKFQLPRTVRNMDILRKPSRDITNLQSRIGFKPKTSEVRNH